MCSHVGSGFVVKAQWVYTDVAHVVLVIYLAVFSSCRQAAIDFCISEMVSFFVATGRAFFLSQDVHTFSGTTM